MTRAEAAALCACMGALSCLENGRESLARECLYRLWAAVIGARR